ncbi:MAG TPA: hypothetical protein VM432_06670 [Bdellovibrionales bacterium]|jgi:hypothetical protein|nr:hypothetical protein [Bdellovibrionales bacterium]
MKTQFFFLLAIASLLLSGFGPCKKEEAKEEHIYQVIEISRQPADIMLPNSLWEKLQSVGAIEPTGVQKKTDPLTEFAPITMYMVEKNEGILGGRDLEIRFPPGGGEIDLADFVQPLKGSFRVSFKFVPELEKPARGVFFLGSTKPRKIGSETVGVECNKYFDVTSAVGSTEHGDGILVNTTDRRHVSALSGTYFFAATGNDKKVRIASVIIRDRNSRDLECGR